MRQKKGIDFSKMKGKQVAITRDGLSLQCTFDDDGRLREKIETQATQDGVQEDIYRYTHVTGHLSEVHQNHNLVEKYEYNDWGQRWSKGCLHGCHGDYYVYDKDDRLVAAGRTEFEYDRHGALSVRSGCKGRLRFSYGGDTMLDRVDLPYGSTIRYEYEKSNKINPVRRFKDNRLSVEYEWRYPLFLGSYRDHEQGLDYLFSYDASGTLSQIRITRHRSGNSAHTNTVLQKLMSAYGGALELRCGCDQVGTPKVLTDRHGNAIKNICRDSFGGLIKDSLPALFMPIDFAGGLLDRDTGLVRFGYRDYDPEIGRFTAPDPLGDTGGDGDLYDYCVDDPVTMNDPTGLFPPLLLFLGGKLAAAGIAALGTLFAAKTADTIKSHQTGTESTAAMDGVKKAAPYVGEAMMDSTLAGRSMLGGMRTYITGQYIAKGGGDSHNPNRGNEPTGGVWHGNQKK